MNKSHPTYAVGRVLKKEVELCRVLFVNLVLNVRTPIA